MTVLIGLACMAFGAVLGVLAGFALAKAPPMPRCVLCGEELDYCVCRGETRRQEELK